MRKKRKKRKNNSFSKKDLIKISVSFFKNNPTKSFNYKQLSKKFKIKDVQTKSLLIECLSFLSNDGVLKIIVMMPPCFITNCVFIST